MNTQEEFYRWFVKKTMQALDKHQVEYVRSLEEEKALAANRKANSSTNDNANDSTNKPD